MWAESSLKPSFSTSCLFRSKPAFEWLCILGWYNWIMRRTVVMFATSDSYIFPSLDGNFSCPIFADNCVSPSVIISLVFRSKPLLKWLCILGRYRLDYPEDCFHVHNICSTHLSVSGWQFQLSSIWGQLTKTFPGNELLLQVLPILTRPATANQYFDYVYEWLCVVEVWVWSKFDIKHLNKPKNLCNLQDRFYFAQEDPTASSRDLTDDGSMPSIGIQFRNMSYRGPHIPLQMPSSSFHQQ